MSETGGECGSHGGDRWCIKEFVGKLEEKRPLGRPRRRKEDSIKMVFKKWDGGHGVD